MSLNSVVPNLAGKFESIEPKLSEFSLDFVRRQNFTNMTPVQAACIPLFLKNKDVVVEAVTGSGKTLAYLLPLVEKLLVGPTESLFAIILVPTRELARQVEGLVEEVNQSYKLYSMFKANQDKEKKKENLEAATQEEVGSKLSQTKLTEGKGSESEEELDDITNYAPLFQQKLLVGGNNENLYTQIELLKSTPTNLIVATPGRLLKILELKSIKLTQLQVLVFDEADKLLELNFLNTVNEILNYLPKVRRTGLFSATLNENLEQLVRLNLRNPVKVSVKVTDKHFVERRKVPDKLSIQYFVTKPYKKLQLILHLLQTNRELKKAIIYVATCSGVDFFTSLFHYLIQASTSSDTDQAALPFLSGYEVIPLHGQMDPKRRVHCYEKFKILTHQFNPKLLITTDLAARGLDFPDVDLVVNLDLPTDPKSFNHRCGRTARNESSGTAIYFLNEGSELTYPAFLEVRKVPSTKLHDPLDDATCLEFMLGLRDRFLTKDRDLMEKAIKAYVGYIKFYSKHQASFIFRKEEIDYDALAYAYLLLRLPKMPELKTYQSSYTNHPIQMDTVAYLDTKREDARQLQLLNQRANPYDREQHKRSAEALGLKKKRNETAWSEQKLKKERKLERHSKKVFKQRLEMESNPEKFQLDAEETSLLSIKRIHLQREEFRKGKEGKRGDSKRRDRPQKLVKEVGSHPKQEAADDDAHPEEEPNADWNQFKKDAQSKRKLNTKSIQFDIE